MTDRPQICVGAVARRAEHLLLIKRGTAPGLGQWSLPGGRVELGETMAEAVLRELAEEAGIDAQLAARALEIGRLKLLTSAHGSALKTSAYHVIDLHHHRLETNQQGKGPRPSD